MKSSDKSKLILALVILVVAGAVFAWQAGLFGGGATTPPVPPAGAGKAPVGGGPHVLPGPKK